MVAVHECQGCGTGLDVLASRRYQCLVLRKIVNVSISGGRHLGLVLAIYVSRRRPIFGQIVQATLIKTSQFWAPQECFTFTATYAVVNVDRHINMQKTMNVKDNI